MLDDNPCNNYCNNNGICEILNRGSEPKCYCVQEWDGTRCENASQCQNYCLNGGSCAITDNVRYCECLLEYEGRRCENLKITTKKDVETTSQKERAEDTYLGTTIVVIIIVLLILTGVSLGYFFLRKRQLFTHERLQENDFNNPMYQERDAEPFSLDTDKVRNGISFVFCLFYIATFVSSQTIS